MHYNFIRAFARKFSICLLAFLGWGKYADAQTNISGPITSNTNWTLSGSPYIVTGNVLLDSGYTLTIDPGVTVKFNTHKALQISGTLRAIGTSRDKITFTSNAAIPAPGDWDYILFNDKSTDYDISNGTGSTMQYCIIKYSGGENNPKTGSIKMTEAFPFFNYCTIQENLASGIYGYCISSGTVNITNSIFLNNSSKSSGGGISLSLDGCIVNISNNIIGSNKASVTDGGGISIICAGSCSPNTVYITSNEIFNNSAFISGGGIYIFIYYSGGYATILNNTIYDNIAVDGGGLFINEDYHRNWGGGFGVVKNNIIYNNIATGKGGGIWEGGITAINNIIAHNFASGTYGGVFQVSFGDPLLQNHIIDNSAPDGIVNFGDYVGAYNYNTITRNLTSGISPTSTVTVNGKNNNPGQVINCNNNNLYGNIASYEFWNSQLQGHDINFKNTWWGSASSLAINNKVYDFFDDNALSIVQYTPFATSPDTIAPVTPPMNVIKTDLGGGNIKLTWTANTETDLAGYKIYWGSPTGYSFTNSINVGNVSSYTLSGRSITDTIAITAYDKQMSGIKDQLEGHESWFTNAVGKPIPNFLAIQIPACAGDTVFFTDKTPNNYLYANTTWSWSFPGAMRVVSNAQNPKIIYNTSGPYSVKLKVTNIAGTDSITLTNYIVVDTLPNPVISASGPVAFCQGDSVTLNAGAGYTSYQWQNGATTQNLVVKQPSGTYSVTVSNHCGNTTKGVSVTVNPIPSKPTISNSRPLIFCNGDSTVLTSSSVTANQWYKDGMAITGATNTTYTANKNGSYTDTVANASGCKVGSATITITVNTLPAIPVITAGGPTTFCSGGNIVLTSSSATGNQWYKDGAIITGATNTTYTANATGAYTLTITNASNCKSGSAATAVTVNALPNKPTITAGGATTFCSGGSVLLTSSSATGNQWYKDGVPITGATNANYTANASGVYTDTITNTSGCKTGSAATTVIAVTVTTPTISQQGDTLISSAPSGNQWYLNSTVIASAVNQKYKILNTGTYTVKVTNSNGCVSSVSANFPVVITAVNTVSVNNKDWKLYPNPVDGGMLFIQRTGIGITGNAMAQIATQDGKVVAEKSIGSNNQWNIAKLPNGIYYLRIVEKKSTSVYQIIKQ